MDDEKPDEVVGELRKMHDAGKGVVGMKIYGEGRIKEPECRDSSLHYILDLGAVDSMIIGFESTDQIDDAFNLIETALASIK